MSGRGSNKSGGYSKGGGSGNSGRNGGSAAPAAAQPQPQIVTGWQSHQYSQGSGGERYQYIGKDEDTGEPEFVDFGPKGGR